jgi:FkbM family methyltransferase
MTNLLDDSGYNRLVKARHGYMLYNSNDTVVGLSIAHYGEYFESEVDIFRSFLGPGDVAIDAGANMGTHSLAMAKIVGPEGRVIALEPQRLVFQILCANAALNSLENLECVQAAAADQDGFVSIADISLKTPNNFGGLTLTAAPGHMRVRVIKLDDYFIYNKLKLIKVDVQGMEATLLRGARNIIQKFRPTLYVENDLIEKSEELLRLLDDLGYISYWHLPLFHNPNNFFQATRRVHAEQFIDKGTHFESIGFAINMLCVPKESESGIKGSHRVLDFNEHPLKKDCNARFRNPADPSA